MQRGISTWIALSVVGCASAPSPTAQVTPPAAHSPASPSSSKAPAASTAPALPPPQGPASPFFVIGALPEEYSIYPVGERAFLASDRRLAFQLVGNDVVYDPKLERGITDTDPGQGDYYSITGIVGHWPEAAFIYTSHLWNRSGISRLRRWNGTVWTDITGSRPGHTIHDVQAWSNGRLLALEGQYMSSNSSFRVASGNRNVKLPVFTRPKGDIRWCTTHLGAEKFKTLTSGHVFAAGSYCDVQADDEAAFMGIAIERWAPGQIRGTFEVLPFPAGADFQDMLVLGPKEVWVTAHSVHSNSQHDVQYFLVWDGTRWTEQPAPIPSGMSRFWQSSTGEVFIGGSDGSLWQRSSDASFVHVPLPSLDGSTTPPLLTAFWPRATGDLWAIARVSDEKADYQRRYFLLHTQPATQPLPSVKVMDRKAQEVRMPGPPDPNCPTPFVLLYTLSKQAPANYTYPATRAALEGNADLQWSATFVEFERDGRRFFGAKVDDFSVGKTLAKLVEHKVPGSTPQLACHDPVVTRTLGIDLTTGELVNDTKTPAHD